MSVAQQGVEVVGNLLHDGRACAVSCTTSLMRNFASNWLIGFGVFLILCGFGGWAASGFSAYAKTAILSGSVCGALMIVAGVLARKPGPGPRRIGLLMGLVLPLIFCGVFTWRAIVAWQATAAGQPKLYVAVLLTVMAAASAVTLAVIARYRVAASSMA